MVSFMSSSKRNVLIFAVIAAVAAGLFYNADNFWGLVIASLVFVWCLVGALPVMDGIWRTKVGFVVAVFLGAIVALLPTFEGMTGGKFKCPTYIKDRITFGIV